MHFHCENHVAITGPAKLPELAQMKSTVWRLLKNAIVVCHLFAVVLHVIANVGFFTFTPKYIESQFRRTPAESSLGTGECVTACASACVLAFLQKCYLLCFRCFVCVSPSYWDGSRWMVHQTIQASGTVSYFLVPNAKFGPCAVYNKI